jgi:hypothetical protein
MLGIENRYSFQNLRNVDQVLARGGKTKTRNVIVEIRKRVRRLPSSKGKCRVALIQ